MVQVTTMLYSTLQCLDKCLHVSGGDDTAEASDPGVPRKITRKLTRKSTVSGYMSGPELDGPPGRKFSRLLSKAIETDRERLKREAKVILNTLLVGM